jgi:hypothetical protein
MFHKASQNNLCGTVFSRRNRRIMGIKKAAIETAALQSQQLFIAI